MNLNKMKLEDLELMSYTDITYELLKTKKAMNTADLFKKICELLQYSDEDYASKIGDYYTSLTIDKRFVLVDNKWDIRDNHSIEINYSDDDVDDEETDEIEEMEEIIEEEDTIEDTLYDDENDIMDDDDDMDDLAIVDEDDLEDE